MWRRCVAGAVLFVIVAALMLVPGSASAAVVNCATQDLQARLDAAAAGSTVSVKGTCLGNFVIAKDLTLKGSPSA
ncbi:MAG TPA: hypothetical protein VNN79_03635, partial [Actinomycetota bacterium]|nr:hypothetical protein [Actinomycetota bacterium]